MGVASIRDDHRVRHRTAGRDALQIRGRELDLVDDGHARCNARCRFIRRVGGRRGAQCKHIRSRGGVGRDGQRDEDDAFFARGDGDLRRDAENRPAIRPIDGEREGLFRCAVMRDGEHVRHDVAGCRVLWWREDIDSNGAGRRRAQRSGDDERCHDSQPLSPRYHLPSLQGGNAVLPDLQLPSRGHSSLLYGTAAAAKIPDRANVLPAGGARTLRHPTTG